MTGLMTQSNQTEKKPYIAERFGNWCASLEYDQIPETVRQAASRSIVDTLGVIAAGGKHPLVTQAMLMAENDDGISITIGGKLLRPQTAALLNGIAAHAYDFDDTSYTGIMHASAVILPALLAIAAETNCSRERFITAFIAGSEVAYTLADALTHAHYFNGWWSTGTLGLIGATAAVSRLYGLNASQTAISIGLAAAGAAGTKAIVGTDGKPFFVGDAARRAIDFSKAAKAGFSGPKNAIENHRGFVPLLNNGVLNVEPIASLGNRWRLVNPGILLKRYPVCSAAHALIDQTSKLKISADCEDDDIASVICEIPELVDISLVFDSPTSIQQAQFSLPFGVACALAHGSVRLDDLEQKIIDSQKIQSLMRFVEKRVSPELSTDAMRETYPESAKVTLKLKNGGEEVGFCGEAYGMPGRPLSDDDLYLKFIECLSFAGHDADKAEHLAYELFTPDSTQPIRSITEVAQDILTIPGMASVNCEKSTIRKAC